MKNTENSTSKRRVQKAAICFLLSAAILICSACSFGRGNGGTAEPDASQEPTPSATPQPTPAKQGTLRLPMPENVPVDNPSYNPLVVGTEEMLGLNSLVYDMLIGIDGKNMLSPALAVKWEKDPSTENAWLLTLRSNVKWHDGADFTADDVIYTFETLVSLGEDSYYSLNCSAVTNIEKIDSLVVKVTMKSAGMTALYNLIFPIIKDGGSPLCGTGAYRSSYISKDRIVLEVNEGWWDRPPYIKTVEFTAKSSSDTALASYGAGLLNFVSTAKLTVGQYNEPEVTTVKDIMTQDMEVLLVNHRRQYCDIAVFRAGIASSLDRSRIITNIYMNKARSSDVPFTPDSWLFDASISAFDFDRATAKLCFEQAGFTMNSQGLLVNGNMQHLSLKLLTGGTAENNARSDAANAIADSLEKMGIKVEIVNAPHTFGDSESEFMKALDAGDWDIALVGFNLGLSNDLSKYLLPDAVNNYGGYRNAEMTSLISEMANAENEESLRNAAVKLQKLFASELPFICLYFRMNSIVCSADILGIDEVREPFIFRNIKNWFIN